MIVKLIVINLVTHC